MECMELKICMSDKHHRYYKHTKFRQNPRGDPKFLVDLTRNDPIVNLNVSILFLFVHEEHVYTQSTVSEMLTNFCNEAPKMNIMVIVGFVCMTCIL